MVTPKYLTAADAASLGLMLQKTLPFCPTGLPALGTERRGSSHTWVLGSAEAEACSQWHPSPQGEVLTS